MPDFDYVVIGAGQGGALARMLAEAGKSVALVEKKYVGGSCTNVGCTPTKAHIAAAKTAQTLRESENFGIKSHLESVDLSAIVARSQRIVQEFRQENEERLLCTKGLELIYGAARFSRDGDIEVELQNGITRRVRGEKYILAVGSKAEIPEIEGLQDVPFLTHTEALQLEDIPTRLLILGGGYIACEFAQMFARFGSSVTILQNKSQLLPREDKDVAEGVADVLQESGVEIVLGSELAWVKQTEYGVQVQWDKQTHDFTHLLIATGQVPQAEPLCLDLVDVKMDSTGHIVTDDFLRTSNPRVFALGDCVTGPAFTHIAYDDVRILRDGLLYDKWRSTKERLVPYTVFIDPQLGRVGLSESEARKSGKRFDIVRLEMKETARGIETGQVKGFWKVLVERGTDLILGGAFLSGEGGETMAVVEIAMRAGMPYTVLRDAIFAHPTWAESLNNLFIRFDMEKMG